MWQEETVYIIFSFDFFCTAIISKNRAQHQKWDESLGSKNHMISAFFCSTIRHTEHRFPINCLDVQVCNGKPDALFQTFELQNLLIGISELHKICLSSHIVILLCQDCTKPNMSQFKDTLKQIICKRRTPKKKNVANPDTFSLKQTLTPTRCWNNCCNSCMFAGVQSHMAPLLLPHGRLESKQWPCQK